MITYFDGKQVMRGDAVIFPAGGTFFAGVVHQIYERDGSLLVTGYALRVPAKTAVLAQEAYNAYTGPIISERLKQAAQAKTDAESKNASEPHVATNI